jgi:hypothetical protein
VGSEQVVGDGELREYRGVAGAGHRWHGAGVILVGVVLVEGERAEAGEARCRERDAAEAEAPLATVAATHPTASRPNRRRRPPAPTGQER